MEENNKSNLKSTNANYDDLGFLPYLDKGFVRLVDTMPRASKDNPGDWAVVQAARVSYGKGTKTARDDEKLIRYLMKHDHTSPFEMIVLKFHVKCPIFVARQMFRHRTHSANEYSLRYSEVEEEFYLPEENRIKGQSLTNKQSSSEQKIKGSDVALKIFNETNQLSYKNYKKLLNEDSNLSEPVVRELARIVLPLSTYTQFYWVQNMHNFLHFLKLRTHETAQEEIRELANLMLQLVEPLFPVVISSWKEYVLDSIRLTRKELLFLKNLFHLTPEHGIISKKEEDELIKRVNYLLHKNG